MIVAWAVFPAVLCLASFASGWAVSTPQNTREGLAAPPTGFAVLIACSQLCLLGRPGVVLAVVTIVGLTARGVWVSVRHWVSMPYLGVLAATVVFLMSAAPVVATKSATFLGYTVLGDSAIQMLGADALGSGAGIGSQDSSAGVALDAYFRQSGYPSGTLTLLGVMSRIIGQDVAWTYQPFMACATSLLALLIFSLALELGMRRWWSLLAAVVCASPSLLFAYYLQGSIKEVVAALLIPLIAVHVSILRDRAAAGFRPADGIPAALTCAALTTVVGPAAAVWILPAAVVFAGSAAGFLRFRLLSAARVLGFALISYFVASASAWYGLRGYVDVAGTVTTTQTELGNLITPLRKAEAAGVWLNGDFRVPPTGLLWVSTQSLQAVVFVLAGIGAWAVFRARIWSAGCFLLISAIGMLIVSQRGSPWADAKAYAIVSPAVLFSAIAGVDYLSGVRRGPRVAQLIVGVLGVIIGAGVLASNAMSYLQASPAPRQRFQELEELLRGRPTPVLATDFDEFTKYFLRRSNANVPADTWHVGVNGLGAADAETRSYRPAELSPSIRRRYPTIVSRRDAYSVAPPGYRLGVSGQWYDVWVADPTLSAVDAVSSGASCELQLRALVAHARPGQRLLWVASPQVIQVSLDAVPPDWRTAGEGSASEPRGGGTGVGTSSAAADSQYDVWMELSSQARASLAVDGDALGAVRQRLNEPWQAEYFGRVSVTRGRHSWALTLARSGISSGSSSTGRWVRRIQLRPVAGPRTGTASLRSWRRVCGRQIAWAGLLTGHKTP